MRSSGLAIAGLEDVVVDRFVDQPDLLRVDLQITVDLTTQAVGVDDDRFRQPGRALVVQAAVGPSAHAERGRSRECVHGLHVDHQRPRGVHQRCEAGVEHVDVAEGEAERSEEVLTRRSQDSMLVRPREGDVTNGLPVVGVNAPCGGAEHQVELFAREQAICHLGHHARPEPVST